MPGDAPEHALKLTSTVTEAGELELELVEAPVPIPGPGQVLIRVEASPINPSDLGLMLADADLAAARFEGSPERPRVAAPLAAAVAQRLARRRGLALTPGNEGAGVVVAAGEGAEALIGRTVAALGREMYAQYRLAAAADCLVLTPDLTAAEGAAAFVNPLTALAMVEVMRHEGHSGLAHTAAASNLGQMLVRICHEDGVPLVNIVRRREQVELLRALGATHVCDSSAPGFREELLAAMRDTNATLAFDAVGGGRLANDILTAMEAAAQERMTGYSLYGSGRLKQVYVYGVLDRSALQLGRSFDFSWNVGGWMVLPALKKLGPAVVERLRQRVLAGLKTTFASRYTREISLAEALRPDAMLAYSRQATGEKFLLNPAR